MDSFGLTRVTMSREAESRSEPTRVGVPLAWAGIGAAVGAFACRDWGSPGTTDPTSAPPFWFTLALCGVWFAYLGLALGWWWALAGLPLVLAIVTPLVAGAAGGWPGGWTLGVVGVVLGAGMGVAYARLLARWAAGRDADKAGPTVGCGLGNG